MILKIDEKCLHIESDTVRCRNLGENKKKTGMCAENCKGKMPKKLHHIYRLSTVATFVRPKRIGDLLFAVPFFYFGPVLVGSRQIPLLVCVRSYEDPRNCAHGPQLGVR